jgi:hypothetical protein
MPAKKKKGADSAPAMSIPKIEKKIVTLQIVGTRPLIVHAWDQKTQMGMLAKHMNISLPKKGARDPHAEFEASRYRIPDDLGGGDGIPAAGFKQSAVDACRHVDGLKMTHVKGAFQVRGVECEMPPLIMKTEDGKEIPIGRPSMELIPIYGSEPEMHVSTVRLDGGGSADLRFRAMYREWYCYVPVQIAKHSMSVQQVANLFNMAGFHCGVCEWRPHSKKSNNGSYGMFKIADTKEEAKLFKGIEPPVVVF